VAEPQPREVWFLARHPCYTRRSPPRSAGSSERFVHPIWSSPRLRLAIISGPSPCFGEPPRISGLRPLSLYGVEDPSLAAIGLHSENVAIAALIGAVIGVTLALVSPRLFVRAAMDPS